MELVIGEKIPTFDHIIDHIYLGDLDSAISELVEINKIKTIINISNTRYTENPDIEYYYYDIEQQPFNGKENFKSMMSKYLNGQKTTPAIFYNGKLIGGYTDLNKYTF